jgi:anti-sigma factor RsiW
MRCDELTELLPDYFKNDLPASSRSTVEGHLRECSECSAQVSLWKGLAEIPEETPSPRMRHRFDAMLSAYEEGRREHKLAGPMAPWFRPSLAYAAALLILGVGFLAGRWAQPREGVLEVAVLRTELSSTNHRIADLNQLVVLSMLQQQSAGERLQGVSYSLQVSHANPEIVGALLRSLRSDSSVDVRLAALDSLRRYSDDHQVRRGFLDSLQPKQSPMVQIALIDALVEIQDPEAVLQIKALQQAPDLNPVVRDRARWGLAQLTRG